jgi:TfoX/Sxy family transcriptional regulator of competence genes
MAYDLGLADRIRSIVERRGTFVERKMFGGVAFMVNGHMCCGVVKNDLVLRLSEEQAAASLRQPHARPMDFSGKPMKSMIYVSPLGMDSDEALETWVDSALSYVRSVPAKGVRPRHAR